MTAKDEEIYATIREARRIVGGGVMVTVKGLFAIRAAHADFPPIIDGCFIERNELRLWMVGKDFNPFRGLNRGRPKGSKNQMENATISPVLFEDEASKKNEEATTTVIATPTQPAAFNLQGNSLPANAAILGMKHIITLRRRELVTPPGAVMFEHEMANVTVSLTGVAYSNLIPESLEVVFTSQPHGDVAMKVLLTKLQALNLGSILLSFLNVMADNVSAPLPPIPNPWGNEEKGIPPECGFKSTYTWPEVTQYQKLLITKGAIGAGDCYKILQKYGGTTYHDPDPKHYSSIITDMHTASRGPK